MNWPLLGIANAPGSNRYDIGRTSPSGLKNHPLIICFVPWNRDFDFSSASAVGINNQRPFFSNICRIDIRLLQVTKPSVKPPADISQTIVKSLGISIAKRGIRSMQGREKQSH